VPAASGTSATSLHADHPHVSELLLHPVKALRFVGGLLTDRRVSVVRKLLFVVPVLGLLIALILPESLVAVLAGTVLPVVGALLSLPIGATLDWTILAAVALLLLHVFPARIVREYHARLFHRA
jgi:hypothetical protein